MKNTVFDLVVCPLCYGALRVVSDEALHCLHCRHEYSIIDGIPILLTEENIFQADERRFRDNLAYDQALQTDSEIMQEIAQHHVVKVMQHNVERFLQGCKQDDVVLDIGIGFGWHWLDVSDEIQVVGIDFSLTNLKVAKKLLRGRQNVSLICADARALPVKSESIAKIWSVQTFQHFSEELFRIVLQELERVIRREGVIEIIGLNYPLLLRIIYLLCGKRMQKCSQMKQMKLYRYLPQELSSFIGVFERTVKSSFRYSEFFFHPPVKPSIYPLAFERMFEKFLLLGRFCARQIHLIVQCEYED